MTNPIDEALEALTRMQCTIENSTDGGDYKDFEIIRKALRQAKEPVGTQKLHDELIRIVPTSEGVAEIIDHLHQQGYLKPPTQGEDDEKNDTEARQD